jgi:hypothetical protein
MSTTAPTPSLQSQSSLPGAGPGAKPQLVEIDVAPWHRISVLFRAVQGESEGNGKVWYWRPDAMTRLRAGG